MGAVSVEQQAELPDRSQARTRRMARGSGDPRDLEPFVCAGLSAVNLEDYGAGKSAQRPVETAPQVAWCVRCFFPVAPTHN
jgi:hypothetical protein